MVRNVCKLCGSKKGLQQSHIIPKFVFKWLKESSATGYLRVGANPNIRCQDGLKTELLCWDCEQLLSSWENEVSKSLFYPYQSTKQPLSYSEYLLKFSVSLSWRVLTYLMLDDNIKADLSPSLTQKIEQVLATWKNFILDIKPNPGIFEQHLLDLL